MITLIQNLRIGTKLAITSALSILLVGGMIFGQMTARRGRAGHRRDHRCTILVALRASRPRPRSAA